MAVSFFNRSVAERTLRPRSHIHSLVIYDVSDDKRRVRLAKLMEGYGVRVQYSGFEVILDRLTHAAMVAEIGDAITEADSVRIYRVPSNADISVLGYGGRYESVEVIII